MKEFKFKHDKYRKTRGGYSRFLEIHCEKCNNVIAVYQKDGPGPLKRMYLDRIFFPQNLVGLERLPFKKLSSLVCNHCKRTLGVPFLYEKEQRPSFRFFEGAVTKKIIKNR